MHLRCLVLIALALAAAPGRAAAWSVEAILRDRDPAAAEAVLADAPGFKPRY